MTLIDSHCHLYLPEFAGDIDQVIRRAMESGVEKFLLPNIDGSSIGPLLDLCSRYTRKCFAMMGLHPTSVKGDYEIELKIVERELSKSTYVAIGEVGIDLYWDSTFLKEQIKAFEVQIIWAKQLGLPVVIHARQSFDEIFKVLDKHNDSRLKGVFHCFTGNREQANRILDYGNFLMGIGGVVTYRNGGLDKVLPGVPLEKIILETDSPYLAPVPYRGKRNESSYLTYVLRKVAEIYGKSSDEVASTTTGNCINLFNLK